MNIVPRLIPFYQPDINTWSLEARLLRWLTFLWIALGLIILFSASYAVGIEDSGNGWYYFQRQFFFGLLLV